jgi:hypothetical protein
MRTSNHIGLLLAMLGALAVGCSSATHNSAANKDQDETAGGKDDDTTGPTPGGGKTSPGTPSGSTKPPAPPPPKPGTPPTVVYSQSGTTLYRLDPAGPKLDKVGDFSGVDGVCNEQTSDGCIIDIAVDGGGKMYGVSWTALYTIDVSNAKATRLSNGLFPNSLAFAPAGTVDTKAMLVGYDEDKFVRIDPESGARYDIGSLNPNPSGKQFTSSGDLVVQQGGAVFLTAKTVPEGATDFLVQIDPKTGKVTKVLGDTGKTDLWGLAALTDKLYAFTANGDVLSLDATRGAAKPLTVTIPTGVQWWGGG